MIEIVADHGYDAVKVREVVKLAGVSSKTFYRLFGSKEGCFLRTHEMVIRNARVGLLNSQSDEQDWRERPRLIYAAFSHQMEIDPAAARLALVDAYADGPAALEQAQRAEETFAAMIGASLARAPDGVAVPPMVIEGMMAGIARVGRNRLLAGRQGELAGMEAEMMGWAMCFPSEVAAGLADLDLGALHGNPVIAPLLAPAVGVSPTGDRATILAAVGKLVAAEGYKYGDLTVPRIRTGAGVSRRIFDGHFDDVEECFLAALGERAAEAVAQAARAQIVGTTWAGGIYRAITAFCIQIAGDPLLAHVCFQDDFLTGSKGSLARLRLIAGVSDQIRDSAPQEDRASELAVEASAGAIWSIFHHHVLRDWVVHHPEISATLSYMALAPGIGAEATVAAIRDEQATQ
jgi:AcrR family transcriptional regulator